MLGGDGGGGGGAVLLNPTELANAVSEAARPRLVMKCPLRPAGGGRFKQMQMNGDVPGVREAELPPMRQRLSALVDAFDRVPRPPPTSEVLPCAIKRPHSSWDAAFRDAYKAAGTAVVVDQKKEVWGAWFRVPGRRKPKEDNDAMFMIEGETLQEVETALAFVNGVFVDADSMRKREYIDPEEYRGARKYEGGRRRWKKYLSGRGCVFSEPPARLEDMDGDETQLYVDNTLKWLQKKHKLPLVLPHSIALPKVKQCRRRPPHPLGFPQYNHGAYVASALDEQRV